MANKPSLDLELSGPFDASDWESLNRLGHLKMRNGKVHEKFVILQSAEMTWLFELFLKRTVSRNLHNA